jgi:dihydrofolate reductase
MDKIVFSKSLENVTWKNSKLFSEINLEEIKKLKEQPGQDMAIFGSGTIVQQFTNLGLIDEYRLMINPIILGEGKSMFDNLKVPLKLNLLKTKTFGNGNILLYYQPIKK